MFCFIIVIRLEKLDKTNEKLEGVNKISAERLIDATREFSNHTQMLITMKNDLDLIFKRIKYEEKIFSIKTILSILFRLLQMRLNKKYPDSFASSKIKDFSLVRKKYFSLIVIQETADQHGSLDDEEDDGLTSSIVLLKLKDFIKRFLLIFIFFLEIS